VYKKSLIFSDVTLLYLDKSDKLLRQINSKTIKLNDNGTWTATDNYIIREKSRKKFVKEIVIPTDLTRDFILRTIKNEYENIYDIPFYELHEVMQDLRSFGFDVLKFEIRFYYMISIPFLFVTMLLISAHFGIIHFRKKDGYVSVIKGIALGFIIFITHDIVTELASGGRLTIFDSSISIVLIYLALSIAMLLRKDTLSNYNGSPILYKLATKIVIAPIKLYQTCISPFFMARCNFRPSCSEYAIEAIKTHGIFVGTILTLKRIAKCTPGRDFTFDPVPPKDGQKSNLS